MITNEGKTRIKRYLAGQYGTIADSIALGVLDTAENAADTRLAFEVERFGVNLITYDFLTEDLVFKGTIPADVGCKIYEVGLWSAPTDTLAGSAGSRIITNFDSATEDWTNETVESTIARIGVDSLKHTPAASGTVSSVMGNLALDLSGYSGSDTFLFALNSENANLSSAKFKFLTDVSNYYEFTFNTPGSGYKALSAVKSSAVPTGTPKWSDITSIEVRTSATAGGAAAVEYDGIRIEDADTINPDYVLVARKVLDTPVTKYEGRAMEFEYVLDVIV